MAVLAKAVLAAMVFGLSPLVAGATSSEEEAMLSELLSDESSLAPQSALASSPSFESVVLGIDSGSGNTEHRHPAVRVIALGNDNAPSSFTIILPNGTVLSLPNTPNLGASLLAGIHETNPSFIISAVAEPEVFSMLLVGLLGLAFLRRARG